ncbi:MAG: hypothetical protein H7293_00570 [Candidatus Saccharibacteria bacterium]|nr:hypothetical protein [Rhodoferax sp.]
MNTNVKQNDLAYIVAPACGGAIGHFVQVLRRATGNQDIDGVDFEADDVDVGRAIWVVRGHQVPWGDGLVNVFSISDICLRPIRGQEEDAQRDYAPTVADAKHATL